MVSSTAVQIHLDDTATIESTDHGDFDRIRLNDFPTTVDLFLGPNDEVAVHTADRLIEALTEARAHSLARLVKSAA